MAKKELDKEKVVFKTRQKATRLGTVAEHSKTDGVILYLCLDPAVNTLHIVEDDDSWRPEYTCGIASVYDIHGNMANGGRGNLVEPSDVMPSLLPTEEDLIRGWPKPSRTPLAAEELKKHLCGNCWRRLNGKNWGAPSLENMLTALAIKYYEAAKPKEEKVDSSAATCGTSVLTVKIEVEFDLADHCPSEVVDSIENLKDEAERQGDLVSFRVTSNVPLDFDLS
jgi:hypothetical protein